MKKDTIVDDILFELDWYILRPLRTARGSIIRFWQRLTRGWDDSEIWSLDNTFAGWIVPRLKRLREKKCGVPVMLLRDAHDHTDEQYKEAEDKWNSILDEMIEGFSIKPLNDETGDWSKEDQDKYDLAKNLFVKYLDNLWW